MQPTTYSCSACGAEVRIQGGKIVRTCEHEDSVILASMTAHATGRGGVSQS